MTKKIADKGSSEEFLRRHVSDDMPPCLPWPYCTNNKGYGLASIGGRQMTASRWMCILAHGRPILPKTYAAHYCGNPLCVNPKHLRWATPKENAADRKIHCTDNSGERNGKTTITEDDVRAIRAAPPNLAPLMQRYGMSKYAISKIRSGKRWSHVT